MIFLNVVNIIMLCKRPFYQTCQLYSLFCQSSTDFSVLPLSSRIFRLLSFTIVYIIFWPIVTKNVPDYSSNVTFY